MVAKDTKALEEKSITAIKEAKSRFKNPAALWNARDNPAVMLTLISKAFNGKVPFPVLYIDNGADFPESYRYMKEMSKKLKFEFVTEKCELKDKAPAGECCGSNKASALSKLAERLGIDGIIAPGRRDSAVAASSGSSSGIRIRPMLDWSELDVWSYAKKERIPMNPLYFSKGGRRYSVLGCTRCAKQVKSEAKNTDEVIAELSVARPGDTGADAEAKAKMLEKLRALGYM